MSAQLQASAAILPKNPTALRYRFPLGNISSQNRFDNAAFLVEKLAAGDDQAIEFLMKKLFRPVEILATKWGLPIELRQEVLDDTLLVFIQKIRNGKYQLTAVPPAAFAYSIATFVVKNAAAKQRRQRISGSEVETELAKQEQSDELLDHYFEQKEQADFVQNLLARLPEKQRRLIELRYFEQVSDEEIVEQRLTSYTSVKSLKVRRNEAMNRLRELAKNCF